MTQTSFDFGDQTPKTSKTINQPSLTSESLRTAMSDYDSISRSPSWLAVVATTGARTASELEKFTGKSLEAVPETTQKCWWCGCDLHDDINQSKGKPYKSHSPKFNDQRQCAGHKEQKDTAEYGGKAAYQCGACAETTDRLYHPNFKLRAIYAMDRSYRCTLDEDFLSVLEHMRSGEIKPPYVFVQATANSQYTTFMAKPTLAPNLLVFNLGQDAYHVDINIAKHRGEAAVKLLNAMNALRLSLDSSSIELSTIYAASRKEIQSLSGDLGQLGTGFTDHRLEKLTKLVDESTNQDDNRALLAALYAAKSEYVAFGLANLATLIVEAAYFKQIKENITLKHTDDIPTVED